MTWSVYDDDRIRRDGFVLLGDPPDVSLATLKRAVRRDRLVPALPGAYVLPERSEDLAVWARLVCRRFPRAVVTGRAAWEIGTQESSVIPWPRGQRQLAVVDPVYRPDRGPFRFVKRRVPAPFVTDRAGISYVVPVFAAAELLTAGDGAAACDFLRRTGTLPGGPGLLALRDAVTVLNRVPGHAERVRLLAEIEHAPWSVLELHLHRLLRAAGVVGWHANMPLRLEGRTVHIDVAFPGVRVAVEVDGREYHGSSDAFERDRQRWNDLAAAGWVMVRVTWRKVHGDPDGVIRHICSAVASRT